MQPSGLLFESHPILSYQHAPAIAVKPSRLAGQASRLRVLAGSIYQRSGEHQRKLEEVVQPAGLIVAYVLFCSESSGKSSDFRNPSSGRPFVIIFRETRQRDFEGQLLCYIVQTSKQTRKIILRIEYNSTGKQKVSHSLLRSECVYISSHIIFQQGYECLI